VRAYSLYTRSYEGSFLTTAAAGSSLQIGQRTLCIITITYPIHTWKRAFYLTEDARSIPLCTWCVRWTFEQPVWPRRTRRDGDHDRDDADCLAAILQLYVGGLAGVCVCARVYACAFARVCVAHKTPEAIKILLWHRGGIRRHRILHSLSEERPNPSEFHSTSLRRARIELAGGGVRGV
jgi:hypothetical protein